MNGWIRTLNSTSNLKQIYFNAYWYENENVGTLENILFKLSGSVDHRVVFSYSSFYIQSFLAHLENKFVYQILL